MEEKSEKLDALKSLGSISIPNLEILQNAFKTVNQYRDIYKNVLDAAKPTLALMEKIDLQPPRRILNEDVFIPYVRPVQYEILDELRELNQNHRKVLALQSEGTDCLIYDLSEGCLTRVLGGRNFSYDLNEDGKRKKMFEILHREKNYIKTKELKEMLKCPSTQAVAKIAQTFNSYATNTLRLKNVKIIEGKNGSGYRINPDIYIESTTNY